MLALPADGSDGGGGPADSYTPVNFQQLENGDTDLGSTGPAILPAGSFAGRLAVQSGKDSQLRLVDLSDMSGQGGPGHVGGELELQPLPQGGAVRTTPAVWINPADASTWVFVVDSSGSSAMKLAFPGGAPSLVKQWQNSLGGSSPLVANNVLYFANATTIRALDPQTGNLLWSDATKISGNHWQSPIVFNATLYITDEGRHLTAYARGLPVTPTPAPPPEHTNRSPESTPTNATLQPTATPTNTPTLQPTTSTDDETRGDPTNTPTKRPTAAPAPARRPTRTPTRHPHEDPRGHQLLFRRRNPRRRRREHRQEADGHGKPTGDQSRRPRHQARRPTDASPAPTKNLPAAPTGTGHSPEFDPTNTPTLPPTTTAAGLRTNGRQAYPSG